MEAAFYTLDGTGRAVCGLCPHRCRIEKGHYGRCQTRYFDGTTLSALNYGKVTAIALDPIEKSRSIIFTAAQPSCPSVPGAVTSLVPSARTGRSPSSRPRPGT